MEKSEAKKKKETKDTHLTASDHQLPEVFRAAQTHLMKCLKVHAIDLHMYSIDSHIICT